MKKILFVIVALACYCCKEQQNTIDSASYTIDLDATEKEDTIKLSSAVKKVNTIILEDHEYAIIGEIFAIQVFEN
ncbi:MAG: hypothetical protein LBT50_12000, partial [Prevotellaceae bacterium]|nr:hypothetical protein [Prevotellaceae bacterium]